MSPPFAPINPNAQKKTKTILPYAGFLNAKYRGYDKKNPRATKIYFSEAEVSALIENISFLAERGFKEIVIGLNETYLGGRYPRDPELQKLLAHAAKLNVTLYKEYDGAIIGEFPQV